MVTSYLGSTLAGHSPNAQVPTGGKMTENQAWAIESDYMEDVATMQPLEAEEQEADDE